MNLSIRALVFKAPEGGYWARVPAFPGCFTQGETIEELEANLHEAIEGWFGAAQDRAVREAEEEAEAEAQAGHEDVIEGIHTL